MKKLLEKQTFHEEQKEKGIKSEDISMYVEIDGTPFTGINIQNKWILVMGNDVASGKKFDTIEEARKYVESKPWELIVTAGSIFRDILNKNKRKEEKENEK